MSELPRRLSPKTNLSSNWLNHLLDFLRSRDLRPGPGIKLTRTPSGTTVSATGIAPSAREWPALFTVKYVGGQSYMWLPECDNFGPGNYVLLNGSFDGVNAQGVTASADGWVIVGRTGPFFLVAQCSLVNENDEWKAKARISITGSTSEQAGAIVIPLAYVAESGTVLQLHVGIASIVFGISKKTRSYSRIYYDPENKQLRAVIMEKTYANGVCVHAEDDSSSASDEDILSYLDDCSCEKEGSS